jgi:hypothetical protein
MTEKLTANVQIRFLRLEQKSFRIRSLRFRSAPSATGVGLPKFAGEQEILGK